MRFVLLPGHRFDTVGVAPLIDGIAFDAILADKAFDSNWIIAEMNERGAAICISQRPQRKVPLQIDLDLFSSSRSSTKPGKIPSRGFWPERHPVAIYPGERTGYGSGDAPESSPP